MTRKPTALGAYIFAGGFTLGVKQAGFDVLAHLEETDYGVKTARYNFPKLDIRVGPENWQIEQFKDRELDLLYGNPPCAAWSVAGYTKTRGTDKWKTDPRVACTERHFNLMLKLRPKVWIWESVTQAYTKGREFVKQLEERAIAAGYSVAYVLHDAQHLGLAQVRKRFFMLCHRIEVAFPSPNWAPPPTPVEVLADIAPEDAKVRGSGGWPRKQFPPKVMARVRPGERLRNFWERENPPLTRKLNQDGTVAGRPSFGHFRLPLDRPGNAVVGYGIIHPTEHRYLAINEMQALCGFPQDFNFTASGTTASASEIARGVCPPVGKWIAGVVRSSLARERVIERPTVREVDFRTPPLTPDHALIRELPNGLVVLPEPSLPKNKLPKGERVKAVKAQVAALPISKLPKPQHQEGIGAYQRRLLLEGHSTASVLAAVHHYWPSSKATEADVAWNRGRLRKAGHSI